MQEGLQAHQAGQLPDAEAAYRRVLGLDADHADANHLLGVIAHQIGDHGAAVELIGKAIRHAPSTAAYHCNLGNALHELGRLDEAAASQRQAIALNPDYAKAHNNLANVLLAQGRSIDAVASYQKALSIVPDDAETHVNLGTALHELGRLDEAEASYRKALALNPDYAEAHTSLGNVLKETGRLDDAIASHRKAIALNPDYTEAHYNLGIVHLLMGDFDNGWREYNWRWRMQDFPSRRAEYDKPLWDGGDLGGKRLLVWPEQGIGDEIMFAGLIPDLIERGIDVILESEPRLVPLFARSFPPVTCIAKGGANQPFDFHIPTGGLGQVLRPSLGSFPDPAPYLVADPELRTTLRDRYHNQEAGALVGLAWHSASPYAGRESSLTLPELHPLLETPEVTFVNLQYGDTADQRSAFARETGIDIVHDDQVDQMADMDAFASQVAAMDLVVSIDNSATQLAGALGVPTWGLLRAVPFWLWGMNGDDSIWYPSMRLFRQSRPGDWNGVIKRVCRALGDWAGSFRN